VIVALAGTGYGKVSCVAISVSSIEIYVRHEVARDGEPADQRLSRRRAVLAVQTATDRVPAQGFTSSLGRRAGGLVAKLTDDRQLGGVERRQRAAILENQLAPLLSLQHRR
jgi:hypothetical protein